MAESNPVGRVSPVYRFGLPLIIAGGLTAVLLPLFPGDEMAGYAFHPAVVVGIVWAGQLLYVVRSLDSAVVGGPVLTDVFGLANIVTLCRGLLYAVVAGFVFVPQGTALAWVPALCYGTGTLLDRLDGLVARTVGEETTLGESLDMAFDTFGFVAAPLVAVLWGLLPVWYLALSAARYAFLLGLSWRRFTGRPVYDLPDSNLGRYLAGVQMVFVTIALVPPAPTDLVWTVAPAVLVPSLAVFARDFLVASKRLSLR